MSRIARVASHARATSHSCMCRKSEDCVTVIISVARFASHARATRHTTREELGHTLAFHASHARITCRTCLCVSHVSRQRPVSHVARVTCVSHVSPHLLPQQRVLLTLSYEARQARFARTTLLEHLHRVAVSRAELACSLNKLTLVYWTL